MSMKKLRAAMAALPDAARKHAEDALRAEGLLAADAPLEDAFADRADDDDTDWDCVDKCYEAYDEAANACDGDELCLGKAAIALKKCLKNC